MVDVSLLKEYFDMIAVKIQHGTTASEERRGEGWGLGLSKNSTN